GRFEAAGYQGPGPDAVPRGRGDEIDRLADAFGTMGERITDQFGQLQQAEEARRELLANVSHDVRTPLASLQGYLETLLLKEESLSAEQRREYLQTTLTHTRRLSRLMSGLLELATLETEEAKPRPEPFSLSELAQDVAQKFGLEAERKGITFDFQIPAGLPTVHGDIGLIERVLDNLIKNAVKYTPEGGQVGLFLERSGNGVAVRVSDTGQGIPEEELPHVFERFYRGSRHLPERQEGTGLGLAIAKRILDLHEVSLEVSSRVDRGTTFAFTLPAA
ncbi:MAG TPA: ATP-binding protein, partial [Gammaproteobacteria bacterium]|nr:ATP-binding protein [Gammaproteobacteria bacterium]